MTEHPLPFNGWKVQAIGNGATQTRRPMKTQPEVYEGESGLQFELPGWHGSLGAEKFAREYGPFGAPGNLLWVRETWGWLYVDGYGYLNPSTNYRIPKHRPKMPISIRYKASGDASPRGWKPNIHMPRWASRTTLRVKRVWVEQVQKITYGNVRAEGIPCPRQEELDNLLPISTAFDAWKSLWDSIYAAKFPWAGNPWVFGCEFKMMNHAG